MNDENQIRENTPSRVVHPQPLSIDEILKYVDPAPDSETESLVAAIYEDRRQSGLTSPK